MPLWVILAAAPAMGLGTAVGGWRIVRTMGLKVVELRPIDGFAAETAAATVIEMASRLGIPVSTTHVISSAILGRRRDAAGLGGPLGRRRPDRRRLGGDDPGLRPPWLAALYRAAYDHRRTVSRPAG